MIILTSIVEDNVVFVIPPELKFETTENDIVVRGTNGATKTITEKLNYNIFYDVDSIPEDWTPHKYRYTEEKKWHLNPNWLQDVIFKSVVVDRKIQTLVKYLVESNILTAQQALSITEVTVGNE